MLDVMPVLLGVLKLFGAQQACSVEHALFLNMYMQVHNGVLLGIFGFLLIFIFASFLSSFFFLFRQLTWMRLLNHLQNLAPVRSGIQRLHFDFNFLCFAFSAWALLDSIYFFEFIFALLTYSFSTCLATLLIYRQPVTDHALKLLFQSTQASILLIIFSIIDIE